MRELNNQRSVSRSSLLAIAAVVAGGASCTSILGIGGDFTVDSGNGGGTSSTTTGSTTGVSMGGGGAGGSNPSSSSSSSTGGMTYVESGDITGKWLNYQVALDGSLTDNSPKQFGTVANQPKIYSYDAGTKKFSKPYLPTTASNNGTFTFSGVPDGPYVLVSTNNIAYWLKNRDHVDFSQYQTSSLTRAALTQQPQIDLTVNNMSPWAAGDTLELIDPITASYMFDQNNVALYPRWAAGATSFEASGDWLSEVYGIATPVYESDTVAMFHVGKRSGHSYTQLLDYGTTMFATPDVDATFSVTMNFQPVDPNKFFNYELNLDLPAFEAQVPKYNPRATWIRTSVDYAANPNPLSFGQLMGTADLALQNFAKGTPASEGDVTYSFGTPFQDWPVLASVSGLAALTLQLPGALPVTVEVASPSACLAPPDSEVFKYSSVALKPFVDPPAHPLIDGTKLFNGGNVIAVSSTTPTVSWDAPSDERQAWSLQIFNTFSECAYTASCGGAIECGNYADGCGNVLDCGGCGAGLTCQHLACEPDGGACVPDPDPCGDAGLACGSADDGCGNIVACGTCSGTDICGGNHYGQCGQPQTRWNGVIAAVNADGGATSITVPPGILTAGKQYFFLLVSVSRMNGVVYETTPNRATTAGGTPSIPVCYSDLLTDVVKIAGP